MWKRGKGIKSDVAHSDIFQLYKKMRSSNNKESVSNKEFTKIVVEFNKRVIDKIYKGLVFKVPFNLGIIGIIKSKTVIEFDEDGEINPIKSTLSTDWGTTLKLWRERPELMHKKYIYCENLHTEGVRYKIMWKRAFMHNRASRVYKFIPVRWFKRGLAKFIKNNKHVEYYEF